MNRVMCSTLTNEAFRYDSVCTAHMNNLKITNGPVIVIVDDIDDQELLVEVFEKLGYPNEILFSPMGKTHLITWIIQM